MRLVSIAFAAALLAAPELHATIARAVPFDQKVREADGIVVGRCVESRSVMTADGRQIVTLSTFRVERSLKGDAVPATLTLLTPGGSVDGLHQRTVGVPEFRPGDEQVVFVRSTTEGVMPLYMSQGTYAVEEREGERLAVPMASDLVLTDAQTGNVVAGESARPLRQMENEIRTILERERGPQGPRRMGTAEERETTAKLTPARFVREHPVLLVVVLLGILAASVALTRRG